MAVRPTVLLAILLSLHGCRNDAPSPAPSSSAPRLVSLSPAITRILIDLELGDAIVGRTRFCRGLPDDVPIIGDLLDVDLERLHEVRPTHVLVQAPANGVDPGLAANASGAEIMSWSSVNDVEDVRGLIIDLAARLGPAFDGTPVVARASTLVAEIDAALSPGSAGGPGGPGGWRGRTLLVYGTDPVSIFGRGTYLDDVLTSLGAENASDARLWTELTLEDVVRLDPAAIIRIGGPGDAEAADGLGPLATLDVEAVRTRRLGAVRHPEALIPSSSVIEVAAEMRRVLDGMPD